MTNFLCNLQVFGVPTRNKKRTSTAERLKRARSNFTASAQRQIVTIRSGNTLDGRCWFKRVASADGNDQIFVASLRNGTSVLPLDGSNKHIEVKSEERLIEVFSSAIIACDRGELDDLLLQTMSMRKESV